ncbi:MAG: DUF4386 domain-containing protein [Nitrososphaerales archaeon]
MNSIDKTARIAGFLYLLYFPAHIISDAVRDNFIVPGDAATTASNILARPGLFTLTAVGDLVAAALFGLAAWGLYVLLRPVDKHLALLFLLLNLVGAGIHSLNGLNQFAALLLLQRPDYLAVIPADQLQAAAMFFLDLREKGFLIAQLFYGAWLFPLGYLVFKSGFLPRILGIVLMTHCFTWLSFVFLSFLFPGFTAITYVSYPLGFIAEVGLTLWLLVMGAKARKPALVGVAA